MRDLPPTPGSLAQIVNVAPPQAGEVCVSYAARERAGRMSANGRIARFRDWYGSVQHDYAAPTTGARK